MNSYETLKNNSSQNWDMSDVPFAGAERAAEKSSLQQALRYAPELLSRSEMFSLGQAQPSAFINTILTEKSNTKTLENVKNLANGRYDINYSTDDFGRGFTYLEQASGALDYFDEKYGGDIDDNNTKGFIKTCIAMWPMGNVGSFGVHEFAKSAKIDEGTASLVNMVIDRNCMKLVEARFNDGDETAGARLQELNKNYLIRLNNGLSSGYEDRMAKCACNIQKIVMECEKAGARIAKERKNTL